MSEPPPHAFAQPKDSGERRTKQGHGEGGGSCSVRGIFALAHGSQDGDAPLQHPVPLGN